MVGFVNNATHPQDTGEIRVGLLKVKRNDDACAISRVMSTSLSTVTSNLSLYSCYL